MNSPGPFLFSGITFFIIAAFSAQAAAPVVSNVRAAQRVGTTLVDILYDVSDADGNSPLNVTFQISADGGASWNIPVMNYSGAVGPNVQPGLNRAIVWSAGQDWTGRFTSQCRARVIADDGTVPAVVPYMKLIPAGAFTMGNTYSGVEGETTELPVHSVFVSAFHMETNEVTSALWNQVRFNATILGYTYNNVGGANGTNHPVQQVSWFDVVKWCNARSELEGLTPCYYTDVTLTNIYRSGGVDPFVKWTARGYRLPTESEWEKAARGGLAGQHFPWPSSAGVHTIHITCANANYSSCVGTTRPVGSYPANGYGLNDMAGNVWEWCWDWYGSYSSSPQTDPRGPGSGSYRVLRGGSWYDGPDLLRCASRNNAPPSNANGFYNFGFRCVRGL